MKKNLRDILRLAREHGVEKINFAHGKGSHFKLFGEVEGKPVSINFSLMKADSTDHNRRLTRANIRRAVEGAKSG